MWTESSIVQASVGGLFAHESAMITEQAVAGLDSLDELRLQEIVKSGFIEAGFGVWPEHPYPGQVEARPIRRDRERCDVVLSESPGVHPVDPVRVLRDLDASAGTLFAPVAASMVSPAGGAEPEDLAWIEIKTVGQHTYTHGVPGPNRAYSSELIHAVTSDLAKLGAEPRIIAGFALLVLFCETEEVARHDLGVVAHRCADKGLIFSSPVNETFLMQDRIGNAVCSVSCWRAARSD